MNLLLRTTLLMAFVAAPLSAAEPRALVAEVIQAAGGEDRLPTLFRIKEKLILGADSSKPGSMRTSVLEPPGHWWVGMRDRVVTEKEPAVFLVWAWSLGALRDPATQLEALPESKDADRPLDGLKLSGTIAPAMSLFFDRETRRLVRIDWRKDSHHFSEWKEADGFHYPSRTVGRKPDGRQWYQSDILELEVLRELPAGLKREEKSGS